MNQTVSLIRAEGGSTWMWPVLEVETNVWSHICMGYSAITKTYLLRHDNSQKNVCICVCVNESERCFGTDHFVGVLVCVCVGQNLSFFNDPL